MLFKKIIILVIILLFNAAVSAFDSFTVSDIQVEGNKHVPSETIKNYLTIKDGSTLNEAQASKIVKTLFKTGFFDDVELLSEGSILVIKVVERPSVSSLTLTGNDDIPTDQLKQALKSIGLEEGKIFKRSVLDKVERELELQYFSQGKYAARIQSDIKNEKNNRVNISITIQEGDVAKIKHIKIVGNSDFSEKKLLSIFQLRPKKSISLFSNNDQYSKIKLSADIENLRSFYLDKGYINFSIESTQVDITPDKKDIFITINIHEGSQFIVNDIKLAGDFIVPHNELNALIEVKVDDIFSRSKATASAAAISERLGVEGFAFANVNTIPEVDNESKRIKLTFFITPGKRVYVRRINIMGNLKTKDEVVRRELRQMEGGWISTANVKRSRIRLQRLGFFEEVNIETPAVPSKDDQVDLNISLKERPSGTLMAGMGYSQAQGFLVNASISQDNFIGTGNRVSANINNSAVNTVYSFSYTNPYYTKNGISRGLKGYYRATDSGEANIAEYTTNVYGGAVSYGIPLNEYDTANVSLGYESTQIKTTNSTPVLYKLFLANNSDLYDIYTLNAGWTHDTRNRAIFADDGSMLNIATEIALPGSGLEFYKLTVRARDYTPIGSSTFLVKTNIGYGESYGGTSTLPFFENYYAGGAQSIRGYRSNSLGPLVEGLPRGGAFKFIGNAEFIFQPPFVEEKSNSFRLSLFVDVGNVFSNISDFDGNDLRASTGITAIWITPIAPMTFSYSWPLNTKPEDQIEQFQFLLGALLF